MCQRKVHTTYAISFTSTSLLLSNLHISWIVLTTYTQTLQEIHTNYTMIHTSVYFNSPPF